MNIEINKGVAVIQMPEYLDLKEKAKALHEGGLVIENSEDFAVFPRFYTNEEAVKSMTERTNSLTERIKEMQKHFVKDRNERDTIARQSAEIAEKDHQLFLLSQMSCRKFRKWRKKKQIENKKYI